MNHHKKRLTDALRQIGASWAYRNEKFRIDYDGEYGFHVFAQTRHPVGHEEKKCFKSHRELKVWIATKR